MKDGFGNVQNVLLLGGTSDIGVAIVRELAAQRRLRRVVLAARSLSRGDQVRAQLVAQNPGLEVQVVEFDAEADADLHAEMLDRVFEAGPIDCVISSFGRLGNDIRSGDVLAIRQLLTVNYLSAVFTGTQVIERFRQQGYGTLVVLSSVAAERPRADNYLYASTKAGLDAWANGLADALAGGPIDVVVVRPGYVHTSMTRGVPPAPLATTVDEVAQVTVRAIRQRTPLVWAPPSVRPMMSALRHLPRPVFRAISARAVKGRVASDRR